MHIAMYHYVRKFEQSHPHLHFLDFDDFCRQVQFFINEYGLVTRDEYCDLQTGKLNVTELNGKMLLTFDDALFCHYEYVYQYLKKLDLFGLFFVSTKHFVEHDLLDVHKIHQLTAKFTGDALFELIELAKQWEHFDEEVWSKYRDNVYKMQNNISSVHDFKFVLNYCSPSDRRGNLLDYLAANVDIEWNADDFYLNERQLKEMQDGGMIFGSHTHSHPMMSTLSFEQQSKEIKQSKEILSEILNNEVTLYCHPYGGKLSHNLHTQKALEVNGFKLAFDVNPRQVTANDLTKNTLFIPRFDCNMFPHGKSYLSR